MSYQSFGLRRDRCGGALGEQEAGEAGDVHLCDLLDASDSRRQLSDLDVAGGEPGATEVHRSEVIAAIEGHRRLGGHIVEIGEQLELHDGAERIPLRPNARHARCPARTRRCARLARAGTC